MQEMQIRSLGQEDPLEQEMATHSNIFAWKIPWTEEPGGLQSMRLQRVGQDWSNLAGTYLLQQQSPNFIVNLQVKFIDLARSAIS